LFITNFATSFLNQQKRNRPIPLQTIRCLNKTESLINAFLETVYRQNIAQHETIFIYLKI